ncbi:MAG: hypothetical protein MO853_11260 [Candidatus Protistobacter heckmanni]|nr:hypothetical protein [Candidatus Protistobacter heckmanni]
MRIAIIGCGVAGSVLAAVLDGRPGVEVVCFEKARPSEHAEAGTGLNVGLNAIQALRLAHPELARTVRAASYDWMRWRVELTNGALVFDFVMTELADELGIRIRWSELYRVLRESIPARAPGLATRRGKDRTAQTAGRPRAAACAGRVKCL